MRSRSGSSSVPWASYRARQRVAELEERFSGLPPETIGESVRHILDAHTEKVDEDGLVLYAGTNAMSPLARRFLGSTLEGRPSMGYPGDKYQTFLEHVEELEIVVTDLARRAFGAEFAEVRLQSGTLANLAVYSTFAEPGETIAVLPEAAGGHISHHGYGAPGIRGVEVVDLPYDSEKMNVDLKRLPGFLDRHKPRLMVVGASLLLFPHPLELIREIADGAGTLVVYDAAHVDGLISGGLFQQPLAEGADLITSSTYKSLGGPSGGMIFSNDPALAERIADTAYPAMTANYNAGRLAALAITLAEALQFGERYARACIENARSLSRSLEQQGFTVAGAGQGFTDSHHVGVDAHDFGGGSPAAQALAEAGIYLSGIGLPWQDEDEVYRGIRIGTQEITRRGMRPEHMEQIAGWMGDVLIHKRDSASVGGQVREFRKRFTSYEYCYPDTGLEA
ncbi:MAG: serine hydroxymethyltransferase [Rubrobacteraceae bacterium]